MVGGGVLPVTVHNGNLFFLFGEECEEYKWIDFGGGAKPGETLMQTVTRECCEELDGFLGSPNEIKKLIQANLLLKLNLETYTSFLIYLPYDPMMPVYFNNHHKFIKTYTPQLLCKNGMFEKRQIKWMSVEEMFKKRAQFRHYYRPMLDQLAEHENFLKAEILQNFIH
jgi:8-oxo-dGTP pyrophosphatase MutT (NUDIX family)